METAASSQLDAILRDNNLVPDSADTYNAIARSLLEQGAALAAVAACRRALSAQPEFPDALNNLGNALKEIGDSQGAIDAYLQLCQLLPKVAEVHCNLGSAYQDAGKMDLALAAMQRASALRPDFAYLSGQIPMLMLQCAQWDGLDDAIRNIRMRIQGGNAADIPPFNLLALPGISAEEQLSAARQEAEFDYQDALAASATCSVAVEPRDVLRIGYLSADFHAHATSWLLASVLEAHDPQRVEVHAFSYGPEDGSTTRLRMQGACRQFHDIRHFSHIAAAKLIAQTGIDILVDLKGHTQNARPQIAALRPAPIVVAWLGYPGSAGHPRLADYIIGDPVVTPLSDARFYSESIAQMPRCYQPNGRRRTRPAPTSRAQHQLPDSAFVFCNFNQTYKINPSVFADWCAILREVPSSVLWMLQPTVPVAEANLRSAAAAAGVSPDRIIFAPPMAQEDHLARIALADLALDSCPYTSHTTASDALWAGVPLLTRIGDTFASRVAASVLTAAGMPELITQDRTAFVQRAIALAKGRNEVNALKAKLETARNISPLFDSAKFARDLEALYHRMWSGHVAGRREPIGALSS